MSTLNQTLGLLPGLRGLDIRFSPRFLGYSPRYEFEIITKNYVLKTATSTSELLSLFELRYNSFLRDHHSEILNDGFDLDEFDSLCDHLMIIDQNSKEIVGTYRILTESMVDHFYSASEFDLSNLSAQTKGLMELGRACIAPRHRNGHVIDLLWKGIAKMASLSKSRFLFGCSSVHTTCPRISEQLVAYFQSIDAIHQTIIAQPIGKYRMELRVPTILLENEKERAKALVPPLLRSYLNAGAKICGHPALDLDFQCIDFLTILDLENINSSYNRRYFKE